MVGAARPSRLNCPESMNNKTKSSILLAKIVDDLALSQAPDDASANFLLRLGAHFARLYQHLHIVYGHRQDFEPMLTQLVSTLRQAALERPLRLRQKDHQRALDPLWYQSEKMLGMACYVDLTAGDLKGLKAKISYFQGLGITYLHLMPLYKSPEGDSDGGYAVSDYRTVNPALGTMDDLRELASAMDEAGINLVLDFVFNHTADDHEWAKAARAGHPEFSSYYYIYDDRSVPDAYEQTLREIFPQVRRGSFTQLPETGQWVWTTFNSFQWDLNYSNPAVFNAIAGDMLYLANAGADCLRLDALAFIWKDMGTDCENRPNAHELISAFNACLKIATPSVVFKSEAIVHPDYVVKYIDPDECQLSYNPLLMALIWNSLATRKTRLLTKSLSHRFEINEECSWVNYARCHDDIGWTFDDEDAATLGINGYDHRLFLNQFYTGNHESSFSTGLGFQYNPDTGDCRVCGSLASLAGLEAAVAQGDEQQIDLAIKRILLIHGIILSIGGVPLLYAGDELAAFNDYSFRDDPFKAHDERWVNRPLLTADMIELALTEGTPQHRVYSGLVQLIALRKQHPVFGAARTQILATSNPHIFAFLRHDEQAELLVLCNFSEHEQSLDAGVLDGAEHSGMWQDLMTSERVSRQSAGIAGLSLSPYQHYWLRPIDA